MERIYTNEINTSLESKEVLLKGWVHELRDLSKVKFLILRDTTGLIQCVTDIKNNKVCEIYSKLTKESVISITGKVKAMKQAPRGVEIDISKIEIYSLAEAMLPIQVNEKGAETALGKRLDYRCLDLRKPKVHAIFMIEAALLEGMQDWLDKNKFVQVFTPCIMGIPSESGAEVFEIKYFREKAFLRQDPQLHRQLAIAGGIEKIYDIGPSWRAELSHTPRHLCEHRTCAVETAFIKDEIDIMRIEEQVIISALKNVKEKCKTELEMLGITVKIPEAPFPEIRFPQIYDIIKEMGGKPEYGRDVDAEGMRLIWEYIQKKYKAEFYWFNRFPSAIKPFYVMKVDEDPEWARSIDLNYRGLELSSGGQRENRYPELMKRVKECNMDPKSVQWFTDFFKYGIPPHGGFAIGLERITLAFLGLDNIREAALFPRDPERKTP